MKTYFSILIILISFGAYAHSLDLGYLEIQVNKEEGIIRTAFDFNPKTMGNPALPFHRTIGKSFWKTGSSKCLWRNINTRIISDDQIRVSAESKCPEMKHPLMLNLSFLSGMNPAYRIIGRIFNEDYESTFIVNKNQRDVRISQKKEETIGHFISTEKKYVSGLVFRWINSLIRFLA